MPASSTHRHSRYPDQLHLSFVSTGTIQITRGGCELCSARKVPCADVLCASCREAITRTHHANMRLAWEREVQRRQVLAGGAACR